MSIDEFHTAVTEGDFTKVKLLLSSDTALVNGANESGMLPLHQACFRGHMDIAEYLLQNGADVNSKDHKQGYTSLMFAAVTGNLPMTKLLLQRGARVNDVNKIQRTAAQMASFVGNHHISTLINNFLEESEIECYIKDSSGKPRLHPKAARGLYNIILDINFTPIKIFLMLDVNSSGCVVLSEWRQVVAVLEDLLEKYFVPHQTHEALALKFYLIACCIRKAGTYVEQHNMNPTGENHSDKKTVSQTDVLKKLIREFLQGLDPHGLPGGQERFLRQILPSFPHHESTLWQHTVRQIAQVQPGYSPTALSILEYAINGQSPFASASGDSTQACSTCGERGDNRTVTIKRCNNCREVGYCSVDCQRLHWFTHKKYCHILKTHHDRCEQSQRNAAGKTD